MFDKGQKQSSTLSCDSSYLMLRLYCYYPFCLVSLLIIVSGENGNEVLPNNKKVGSIEQTNHFSLSMLVNCTKS